MKFKNLNLSEFKGNIENAISNGDIRYIICFDGVNYPSLKFLNDFNDKKEIEETEYTRILIKSRSPFRIGEIQTNILKIKDVYNKDIIDFSNLRAILKNITKKYKNNILGFFIPSQLLQYKNDFIDILTEVVRDTKVVIII